MWHHRPCQHLFHSERPSKSSLSVWWAELLDNSRSSSSLFVCFHWHSQWALKSNLLFIVSGGGAEREKSTENFPSSQCTAEIRCSSGKRPAKTKHKTFFNQFVFRNATEFDDRWTHSVNTNQEIEANTFLHQRQSQDRFHSVTSTLRAATIDSQVSNSEERRSPWQIPLNTLLSSISNFQLVEGRSLREKLFSIGRRPSPTTNRTERWNPCWETTNLLLKWFLLDKASLPWREFIEQKTTHRQRTILTPHWNFVERRTTDLRKILFTASTCRSAHRRFDEDEAFAPLRASPCSHHTNRLTVALLISNRQKVDQRGNDLLSYSQSTPTTMNNALLSIDFKCEKDS